MSGETLTKTILSYYRFLKRLSSNLPRRSFMYLRPQASAFPSPVIAPSTFFNPSVTILTNELATNVFLFPSMRVTSPIEAIW